MCLFEDTSDEERGCGGAIPCVFIGGIDWFFDQSAHCVFKAVLLHSSSSTYSMCLTTVTPSLVILGSCLSFSITTFLPIGPRVIAATLATSWAVSDIIWVHSGPKIIFFADEKNFKLLSIIKDKYYRSFGLFWYRIWERELISADILINNDKYQETCHYCRFMPCQPWEEKACQPLRAGDTQAKTAEHSLW